MEKLNGNNILKAIVIAIIYWIIYQIVGIKEGNSHISVVVKYSQI